MILYTDGGFISDTSFMEVDMFVREVYRFGFDDTWEGGAWGVYGKIEGVPFLMYMMPAGNTAAMDEYMECIGAKIGGEPVDVARMRIAYVDGTDDRFWSACYGAVTWRVRPKNQNQKSGWLDVAKAIGWSFVVVAMFLGGLGMVLALLAGVVSLLKAAGGF